MESIARPSVVGRSKESGRGHLSKWGSVSRTPLGSVTNSHTKRVGNPGAGKSGIAILRPGQESASYPTGTQKSRDGECVRRCDVEDVGAAQPGFSCAGSIGKGRTHRTRPGKEIYGCQSLQPGFSRPDLYASFSSIHGDALAVKFEARPSVVEAVVTDTCLPRLPPVLIGTRDSFIQVCRDSRIRRSNNENPRQSAGTSAGPMERP